MKRYDLPRGFCCKPDVETDDGEWVRFDDVEALQKQISRANHENASCSMLAARCNALEAERDALLKTTANERRIADMLHKERDGLRETYVHVAKQYSMVAKELEEARDARKADCERMSLIGIRMRQELDAERDDNVKAYELLERQNEFVDELIAERNALLLERDAALKQVDKLNEYLRMIRVTRLAEQVAGLRAALEAIEPYLPRLDDGPVRHSAHAQAAGLVREALTKFGGES